MDQSATAISKIPDVIQQAEDAIIADWIKELSTFGGRADSLIKSADLKAECVQFIQLFRPALSSGQVPRGWGIRSGSRSPSRPA